MSDAVAPHGAGDRTRPLLGLRREPGRLALAVFRGPLRLYQHGGGALLGHTFLLFEHRGRRTGRTHQTVAMVVGYDPATREAVVCSAWGPDTDWMRNLRASPALRVHIGRESYVPDQHLLSADEARAVIELFRRHHPWRVRLLATLLGWGDLGDDAVVTAFVEGHPFVSFRPTAA